MGLSLVTAGAVAKSDPAVDCPGKVEKLAERSATQAAELGEKYERQVSGDIESIAEGLTPEQRTAFLAAAQRTKENAKVQEAHDRFQNLRPNLIRENPGETYRSLCDLSLRKMLRWERERYERYLQGWESRVQVHASLMAPLRDKEGYLVVAAHSEAGLDYVLIRGRGTGDHVKFGPISLSEHFRVYRVKAGTYRWARAGTSFGTYDLHDQDTEFAVIAGAINYAGVMEIQLVGWNRILPSLEDRPSVVLSKLELHFPYLLDWYPLVNRVVPDDPFIPFYLSERKRMTES